MRRVDLVIEHRYGQRILGKHRLDPRVRKSIVVGSSKKANFVLSGSEVSGIHALIEFQLDHWKISDISSETGTWIDNEAIVSKAITDEVAVKIGLHEFKLRPLSFDSGLYQKNDTRKDVWTGKLKLVHEVVLKKDGQVVHTRQLSAKKHYRISFEGKEHRFHPPQRDQSKEWTITHLGPYEIRQRLVDIPQVKEDLWKSFLEGMRDPELRMPLGVAGCLVFLLGLFVLLMPKDKNIELNQAVPELNAYNRVIFDSNLAKKRKAQAKQMAQAKRSTESQGSSGSAPKQENQPPVSAQKAITKIRASGLSQLVGKISKRASSNSKWLVKTSGVSPDNLASGRSVAAISPSLLKQGAGGPGSGDGTFRLNGVGTSGKGGGKGNYKEGTGLSTGAIGTADVGIVEEETEVVGGLDKEEIAKTIRSQLGEIRYCYERQLSANPDLYGKVMVKFTIGAEGKVVSQKIGSTTLSNALVEGCILRRVSSWKFPKPAGGTSVVVSYPFLLKSTN